MNLNYDYDLVPSSIPVVFLHGFLGSRNDLKIIGEKLECSSLYISLPGHDDSILKRKITFNDFNLALENILKKLKIGKFIFYGYSMGGRLALEYAKSARLKPCGIFLESASFGSGLSSIRAQDDLDLAQKIVKLDSYKKKESFLIEWYEQGLFKGLNRDKDKFKILIEKISKNNFSWISYSLQSFSVGLQSIYNDDNIPLYYYAGEWDIKYAGQDLPFNSKKTIIENSSHNIHLMNLGALVEHLKKDLLDLKLRT